MRLFLKNFPCNVIFSAILLVISGCATTATESSRNHTINRDPLWQIAATAAKTAEKSPNKMEKAQHARHGMDVGDQCVMTNPEEAACYYYRALNTGLYYEAHIVGYQEGLHQMVADLTKVIQLDDHLDYGGAYRMLGEIYSQTPEWGSDTDITRDISKAESYFLKAIEVAPDYPGNYIELSKIRVDKKEYTQASESLLTANRLLPYWQAQTDYPLWVRLSNEMGKKMKSE